MGKTMSILLTVLFIFICFIALAHRQDKIRTGQIKHRWYDF